MSRVGVDWEANKKAWMTTKIFETWLVKFNLRMRRQDRQVLPILDNAPCHGRRSVSNVRLLFLTSNITSKLQPLNQGIIQAFKLQYRTLMIRWLLTKMDECSTVTQLAKKINVLEAVQWVTRAWASATELTMIGCFRKCGIVSVGNDAPQDPPTENELMYLCDETGVSNPHFVEDLDCFEASSEMFAPTDDPQEVSADEEEEELAVEEPRDPHSPGVALRAVETLKLFALTSTALKEATHDAPLSCEKQIQDYIISRKKEGQRQTSLLAFFALPSLS